jgi:hypothetical protein
MGQIKLVGQWVNMLSACTGLTVSYWVRKKFTCINLHAAQPGRWLLVLNAGL